MIEDGRAYGVAMAMQALLHTLERKKIFSHSEMIKMLDAVGEEISDLQKRGAISPAAAADAHRAVGLMHVPPKGARPA